jgi:hypothetical protein
MANMRPENKQSNAGDGPKRDLYAEPEAKHCGNEQQHEVNRHIGQHAHQTIIACPYRNF